MTERYAMSYQLVCQCNVYKICFQMLIMLYITKMLPALANGLAGASDLENSFLNVHIFTLWETLHFKQMN